MDFEGRVKLNPIIFSVKAEGSLFCCEVDGAVLTREYNDLLHYRLTQQQQEAISVRTLWWCLAQ
jgi:hypothetical protein